MGNNISFFLFKTCGTQITNHYGASSTARGTDRMSRVKSSVRKINSIFDEVSASSAQSPSAKFWTPWLKPALGYLFAVAGMIWVLHDFQFGLLRGVIANLDWRWIALAIVCDTLSRVCQGIRWRLLLKPKGELSTFRATQAIYAGLFTNEI